MIIQNLIEQINVLNTGVLLHALIIYIFSLYLINFIFFYIKVNSLSLNTTIIKVKNEWQKRLWWSMWLILFVQKRCKTKYLKHRFNLYWRYFRRRQTKKVYVSDFLEGWGNGIELTSETRVFIFWQFRESLKKTTFLSVCFILDFFLFFCCLFWNLNYLTYWVYFFCLKYLYGVTLTFWYKQSTFPIINLTTYMMPLHSLYSIGQEIFTYYNPCSLLLSYFQFKYPKIRHYSLLSIFDIPATVLKAITLYTLIKIIAPTLLLYWLLKGIQYLATTPLRSIWNVIVTYYIYYKYIVLFCGILLFNTLTLNLSNNLMLQILILVYWGHWFWYLPRSQKTNINVQQHLAFHLRMLIATFEKRRLCLHRHFILYSNCATKKTVVKTLHKLLKPPKVPFVNTQTQKEFLVKFGLLDEKRHLTITLPQKHVTFSTKSVKFNDSYLLSKIHRLWTKNYGPQHFNLPDNHGTLKSVELDEKLIERIVSYSNNMDNFLFSSVLGQNIKADEGFEYLHCEVYNYLVRYQITGVQDLSLNLEFFGYAERELLLNNCEEMALKYSADTLDESIHNLLVLFS